MRPLLPDITRNYILNQVSQEQIFSHYTGLSPSVIDNCIDTNHLIKSPIRVDHDPTVGFYYTESGRLRMRDLAGYFWGDCFDLVAYRLRVDAKSSQGFAIALEHVAKEFKLHKFSKDFDTPIDYKRLPDVDRLKKDTQITPHFRNWMPLDAKVWKYLTRADLEFAKIYPCLHVFVNSQLVYRFNPSDPAYAYCFAPDRFKIYFPYRKEFRFLSNTAIVQGIHLIEPAQFGLITKSYKDVVYFRKFGVNTVAPAAESVLITPDQYFYISKMWDMVGSLMDYDNTGIHMAWLLRKKYGVEPMFLKGKTIARKVGYEGAKDFSDYVQLHGVKKTENLIAKTIEFYNEKYDLNLVWKPN